jgi:hypothetical protein
LVSARAARSGEVPRVWVQPVHEREPVGPDDHLLARDALAVPVRADGTPPGGDVSVSTQSDGDPRGTWSRKPREIREPPHEA